MRTPFPNGFRWIFFEGERRVVINIPTRELLAGERNAFFERFNIKKKAIFVIKHLGSCILISRETAYNLKDSENKLNVRCLA